jgi:hypothetical protein
MRSKVCAFLCMMFMALSLMAQSATPTSPATAGDNAKSCPCCNQADGKMACCGKGASCCSKDAECCKGGSCCQGKDGKSCPMMSKDSSGKMSCCADGKCSMMSHKDGKSCCSGKMCERPKTQA